MLSYEEWKSAKAKGEFDYDKLHERYYDYFRENIAVGDGVTVHLWSDAHAYTVIARTPKTLTLRRCKATLVPEFKPEFIPGGFCAHCTNQDEQRYTYEEDENGEIVKAFWSERKKGFYVERILRVTFGRHEFYDYNF